MPFDYKIEMPSRRQERNICHINLACHFQTVLLPTDLEPVEDAREFGSMEHGGWSDDIADWVHLSAE